MSIQKFWAEVAEAASLSDPLERVAKVIGVIKSYTVTLQGDSLVDRSFAEMSAVGLVKYRSEIDRYTLREMLMKLANEGQAQGVVQLIDHGEIISHSLPAYRSEFVIHLLRVK